MKQDNVMSMKPILFDYEYQCTHCKSIFKGYVKLNTSRKKCSMCKGKLVAIGGVLKNGKSK